MRLSRRAAAAAVWTAALIACRDHLMTAPADATSAPGISPSLVPLDPFGIGRGPGGCDDAAHHQFDFWVGKWDVFSGGALAGTNEVKSRVRGCVVEENWTGASLGRGRSLNAYDAATGTWTQMWVASGGCPFNLVLLEGGFENGSMTMQGERSQPDGFLIGPPCGPPPPTTVTTRATIIRWTALESGSVLQQFASANDGAPLPALPAPSSGSGLRYDRVDQVTALTPPDPSFCPARPEARQFDFMLGTWQVHEGKGKGAQGTATFAADMNTCLLEETLTAPGGYEGLAFSTYDAFTGRWYRTYVDSDGRRIVMTGGVDDAGAMVLRGTRPGAGDRSVEVRVTWRPLGSGEVVQKWEYSRDAGKSWKAEKEIRYTKS